MFASKQVSKFLSIQNVSLILMWVAMVALLYYIKVLNRDAQPFEPFSILGLSPGASDADIKKAYRKLSLQYHPDKNPDPAAHKFFVDYISKAYQALTDEVARANWEKYGHPDGQQAMNVGIALPKFMLDIQGPKGAYLLLGLVGVGILLPLIAVVIYLSRSSKYTGNNVIQDTLRNFYQLMKPSLAPSKVIDVLTRAMESLEMKVHVYHGAMDKVIDAPTKAMEFLEMRVRGPDLEPMQRVSSLVCSELNLAWTGPPSPSPSPVHPAMGAPHHSNVIDVLTNAMEFLEMKVHGLDVESPCSRLEPTPLFPLFPIPIPPSLGATQQGDRCAHQGNGASGDEGARVGRGVEPMQKVFSPVRSELNLDPTSPFSSLSPSSFLPPFVRPHSKVIDVLTKAMEFLEMKVRGSDVEPMQKVFSLVRHELNLDPKNLKQETKKFWTRFPALIKVELLLLAQLTRQADLVPPELRKDFNTILKLTPRLMEELIKLNRCSNAAEQQRSREAEQPCSREAEQQRSREAEGGVWGGVWE
ncbi:unnamed protein product [Closterium sp. NIES-65]|nr:unnamed protein product [Closterium sp. NIES-65]